MGFHYELRTVFLKLAVSAFILVNLVFLVWLGLEAQADRHYDQWGASYEEGVTYQEADSFQSTVYNLMNSFSR